MKATKEQLEKFYKNKGKISVYMCECTTFDGSNCSMSARYEIDGIKLCSKHAGGIAIAKLMQLGYVKKIEIINPWVSDPLCNIATIYDRSDGTG